MAPNLPQTILSTSISAGANSSRAAASKGWRSESSLAGAQAWHLRLVAADGSWRLVGRYQPGDTELRLEPAVTTP